MQPGAAPRATLASHVPVHGRTVVLPQVGRDVRRCAVLGCCWRCQNSLGVSTLTSTWSRCCSRCPSFEISTAPAAWAKAANLRSSGSGISKNCSGWVVSVKRSAGRKNSAVEVVRSGGICCVIRSISRRVASFHAIRNCPCFTASTICADALWGLNLAATKTYVSNTTVGEGM